MSRTRRGVRGGLPEHAPARHTPRVRSSTHDLLDGPRFRVLCLALVSDLDAAVQHAVQAVDAAADQDFALPEAVGVPADVVAGLASAVAAVDLADVRGWRDPLRFLPALGATVDSSMPWQPPIVGAEAITAFPEVRSALAPVAEAVLSAPATTWWATDLDLDAQWVARPVRDGEVEPVGSGGGVAATVARWRRNHEDDEARGAADRAVPVHRTASGAWWSTPLAYGDAGAARFISSTRRVGSLGAGALELVEDGFGDDEVVLQRVTADREPRVWEVHSAEDWARLVSTYPKPARWARRGAWWPSTGLEADWLVPDLEALAVDVDAVHVSVQGYLAAAGRALEVDGGATVLAGWAPDETSWFTDDVTVSPVEERWVRGGDGPSGWNRAS